jgi:hypothetical protein
MGSFEKFCWKKTWDMIFTILQAFNGFWKYIFKTNLQDARKDA